MQRFEPIDFTRFRTAHGVPKFPIQLQSEPKVGRHPNNSCLSKRRIRRDRPLASNDLVEPRESGSLGYWLNP